MEAAGSRNTRNTSAMASKQSHLNPSQIELLEILYKYRFSNRQLIAESLGINAGSSLHERLRVLLKHGFIGMRLEKRLKLVGMPAAYYLTPKGMRALRVVPDHAFITDSVIKASYKDKAVGQAFITHTMNIHRYTNALRHQYEGLRVFTKREMSRYSYFPSQLPDAFLSLPTDDPLQPKRFFLDFIPDALPSYRLDRRLARYCQFFDEGGWDISGTEVPALLFIGERAGTERRIRRIAQSIFRKTDADELVALTTTTSALSKSQESAVWSSIEEPDELHALVS